MLSKLLLRSPTTKPELIQHITDLLQASITEIGFRRLSNAGLVEVCSYGWFLTDKWEDTTTSDVFEVLGKDGMEEDGDNLVPTFVAMGSLEATFECEHVDGDRATLRVYSLHECLCGTVYAVERADDVSDVFLKFGDKERPTNKHLYLAVARSPQEAIVSPWTRQGMTE